jgi:hypothetical protein
VNLARYHALLKRIQWAGDECCPACMAYPRALTAQPTPGWGEHETTCELAAVLREIEDEMLLAPHRKEPPLAGMIEMP